MSLSLISICGIILSPLTEPATSVSSLYESHYGCTPEIIEKYDGDLVKPKNLTSYFPSKKTLWPIFTEEQIENKVEKEVETTEGKIRKSFFDKYVDKIKDFLDNAE